MAETENRREFFSGQGKVFWGRKNIATGKPVALYEVGVCDKLMTNAKVEVKKKKETETGKNATIARFETTTDVEVEMTICEIRRKALELFLHGKSLDVTGATVTAEAVKAVLGASVMLDKMVDTFASLTNTGGATTYVEGTDYQRKNNIITFPSTGSNITDDQDLEANYDSQSELIHTIFTSPNFYSYWVFDGLNRASDDSRVIIEMYKARFDPTSFEVINEDFANYELKGDLHYDDCFADNDQYGGFMRIRRAAA